MAVQGDVSTPEPERTPQRGARARRAILNAADDLLVEEGFAGVTIEGIAARAGVAKQTIYRWWPSKVELLMDGMLADVDDELQGVDTGSAVEDLRDHLAQLSTFLVDTPPGRVLCALIGHAQHDPKVALELRQRYLEPRREQDREILVRGMRRGEVRPDLDPDAALDTLEGPIYFRVLIANAAPDEAFIDTLVERVLPALLAAPAPAPAGGATA